MVNDDAETCPLCKASSRKVGIEIQGLYDGVLYWVCPSCMGAWPRWTDQTPRGKESQRCANVHNAQRAYAGGLSIEKVAEEFGLDPVSLRQYVELTERALGASEN